jgi:transposase-like protein
VGKKRVNKYPEAFRRMALERIKDCVSVSALATELGVHRTVLYHWTEGTGSGGRGSRIEKLSDTGLRKQVRDLKRVLAEKTLEVDFSKVPCKKSKLDARAKAVLARRRLRPSPGDDADARQPQYRADVPTGEG